MEFVLGGANVSLFCAATGDASLYTSKGFGIVGGFAHERVRSAARMFVELCEERRDEMMAVDVYPPPRDSVLRFYGLTEGQVLAVEVPEASLHSGCGFAALWNAGQTVTTELRRVASSD
jgi:hypothetical protein